MRYLNASHTHIDMGDGRIVPADPENSDYAAIVAAGVAINPFVAPPIDLFSYAAAKRYDVETGGTTHPTFGRVSTDRETQNAVNKTLSSFDAGLVTGAIDFKGASGWISADHALALAIGGVIAAHVQASFSAERLISDEISAGTITTTEQIDAAAWPSNI